MSIITQLEHCWIEGSRAFERGVYGYIRELQHNEGNLRQEVIRLGEELAKKSSALTTAEQETRKKDAELQRAKKREREAAVKIKALQELETENSSRLGEVLTAVVDKLLTTKDFSAFFKEVSGMSNAAARSHLLEHISHVYEIDVKEEEWGWRPHAVEKAKKNYATRVLHNPPRFGLIKHLASLDSRLTPEEIRKLSVDTDPELVEFLSLDVPGDSSGAPPEVTQEGSEEEREGEGEERTEEGRPTLDDTPLREEGVAASDRTEGAPLNPFSEMEEDLRLTPSRLVSVEPPTFGVVDENGAPSVEVRDNSN